MDNVEWTMVPNIEVELEVTPCGRVRTRDHIAPSKREGQPSQLRRGVELNPEIANSGYRQISVRRNGKRRRYLLHRLIALTFCDGYFEGATVDHLDGDRLNNSTGNLEWVSRSENTRRQNADGRGVGKGEDNPTAKLSNAAVALIKTSLKSAKKLAHYFAVSESLIYMIRSGRKRVAK